MKDVIVVLKDLQPAAFIVVIVAFSAILAGMVRPLVGPWLALLALAGVVAYVGHRVQAVDPRPAWLLPLAIAGLFAAVGAGYRLWSAVKARSNNDLTVAYVFPTALAIFALWLSVALIEYDASRVTAVVGLGG